MMLIAREPEDAEGVSGAPFGWTEGDEVEESTARVGEEWSTEDRESEEGWRAVRASVGASTTSAASTDEESSAERFAVDSICTTR